MNQRLVNVTLTEIDEKVDVLRFEFDQDACLDINLNSDSCQSDIKAVFEKILQISVDEDLELVYSVAPKYNKGLYKDVCDVYIKEIKSEIKKSVDVIRSELQRRTDMTFEG